MTDNEYTSKFLELLRYAPYLKEEKAKIQRFARGLPMAFKDRIELDEPRSLEEVIRKLDNFFEQSKHIYETKPDRKGNANNKEKWDKKQVRPQDYGNNENVAPPKRFNVYDRGQGHQSKE